MFKIPALLAVVKYISIIVMIFNISIANGAPKQNDPEIKLMHWMLNNVKREALVSIPTTAKTNSTPIIFAFHGHGGNMTNLMKNRAYEKLWPEAIIVYPQGLNTPGQLTDPRGIRSGWQKSPGDMGDRDLIFFDAMLKTLKHDYKVDEKRIYATGHSNGGGFTYLLWATKGDQFAAFAPSAAVAGKILKLIKPKPAIHIMGENDPLVKPFWQKLMCQEIMKINGCAKQGNFYAQNAIIYPSSTHNPFVWYSHSGNHTFPSEADEVIIKFFKNNSKP